MRETIGTVSEIPFTEVIAPTTAALTAAQVTGTQVNNFGQEDDAELTLPVAAEGLSFTALLGVTVAKYWRLKAAAVITLNGTAGSAGGYVGQASATKGSQIQFRSVKTGASEWSWFATSITGTWVAG